MSDLKGNFIFFYISGFYWPEGTADFAKSLGLEIVKSESDTFAIRGAISELDSLIGGKLNLSDELYQRNEHSSLNVRTLELIPTRLYFSTLQSDPNEVFNDN